MNFFQRIWRSLTITSNTARRIFPPGTLSSIEALISLGEQRHLAEIQVIIETGFSLADIFRGKTSRLRAIELFEHYAVNDTHNNLGMLLYINLAERKIEIVTDHGIDATIDRLLWQAVCSRLAENFRARRFHDGICEALGEMNGILEKHFPRKEERINLLSDAPIML